MQIDSLSIQRCATRAKPLSLQIVPPCRRRPSVAWIVLNCGDFTIVTCDPIRYRSSPPAVRSFCGKCGTPLTYQHDDSPDTVDVTTATLDLPDAFPPTREIWTEHKIAWEVLNEDLRHYRRGSSESSGDAA